MDENSRAIFNRYGNWFETKIRVHTLPENIIAALEESDLGTGSCQTIKSELKHPESSILYT